MPAPIVDDLLDLFPDIVIVRPFQSQSGKGAESYGSPVNRRAQVTQRVQIVKDPSGQERVSRVMAILAGAFNTSPQDEFTLPARFDPNKPKAIAVAHRTDENGPHHEVVYF